MGFEDKILSREINHILYEQHKTLATAESCTGGGVAQAIISIPGSSMYFKGGVVAYTNEVKMKLLNVPAELIEKHTAVSEEVAIAMVKGAIDALDTDYAVSVTGTAGPGGGTADIPVGTIWLACGSKDDIRTMKLTEDFGRDINLAIATSKVLQMLLELVQEDNK